MTTKGLIIDPSGTTREVTFTCPIECLSTEYPELRIRQLQVMRVGEDAAVWMDKEGFRKDEAQRNVAARAAIGFGVELLGPVLVTGASADTLATPSLPEAWVTKITTACDPNNKQKARPRVLPLLDWS